MPEIKFENKLSAIIGYIRQKLPLAKADAIIRAAACLGEGLAVYGGRRYDEYSIITMVRDFAAVTDAVDLRAEFYNYYGGVSVSLVPGIMATAAEIAQWQEEITALVEVIMANRTAEFDGEYNTYENDFEGYVEHAYKHDYPLSYTAKIDGVEHKMPGFIRDMVLSMVRSLDKKKVVKVDNGKLLMEERDFNEEEITLIYDAGFAALRDQPIAQQYMAVMEPGYDSNTPSHGVTILRLLAKSLSEGEELPITIVVNSPDEIGRLPFLVRRFGLDVRPTLAYSSVVTKDGLLSKYSMTPSLTFSKAENAPEYVRPLDLIPKPQTELNPQDADWFEYQARILGWALYYLQPAYVSDAEEYAQSLIERDGDAYRARHAEQAVHRAASEAEWAKRQNGPISDVVLEARDYPQS